MQNNLLLISICNIHGFYVGPTVDVPVESNGMVPVESNGMVPPESSAFMTAVSISVLLCIC